MDQVSEGERARDLSDWGRYCEDCGRIIYTGSICESCQCERQAEEKSDDQFDFTQK